MGRWHAHAAERLGAQVQAVVDPDHGVAAALAARHRCCRTVPDLATALPDVDVVHVCSPADTHLGLATQALSASRHALVEKPIASSVSDTAALYAIAADHGAQLCPVHQFPFQDGVRRALDERETIGPLRHLDLRICSAGADNADDAGRQRVAEEVLVHPFSLVERFLPGALAAIEWHVSNPLPGELQVTGTAAGTAVSIVVSMRGRPPVNRLELIGERATAHVDLFHGFMAMDAGRATRTGKAARPFTRAAAVSTAAATNLVRRARRGEAAYPGLRTLIEAFYGSIAGQADPPIAQRETLAVARACEQVARACSGR